MEKLRFDECENCKNWKGNMTNCFNSCMKPFEALDEFNKYKSLEEQGRLLKLPCAVGDTYFCIDDGSYPNEWEFVNVQQIISVMDKIGKTVFLKRQEAERALAEMERKK